MAFAAILEWKGGTLGGLIVHQDQGSPYTSGDYVTAILEHQADVALLATRHPRR
jgi:transposase InsO family protein